MTSIPASGASDERGDHRASEWWRRLRDPNHGDPGALARLRRTRSTVDVLQEREAIVLAQQFGATRTDKPVADWRLRAVLDLARILAHVKEHEARYHPMRAAGWKRFAGSRRESDAGDDRPLLAEARFRRLLQTGEGEEKVRAFIRLIALLGGAVNVDDLARDFLYWNHPDIGDRVRERWAFIYFHASDASVPALAQAASDIDPDSKDKP